LRPTSTSCFVAVPAVVQRLRPVDCRLHRQDFVVTAWTEAGRSPPEEVEMSEFESCPLTPLVL
jgi:hypothetical protein